ncbi:hypothetical protein [Pseudomonas rhodesiae]|uniref:hypothetical protein n=1 Tax=Pseudomonas rhodesiae TaxID=76760 RepID=UPI000B8C2C0F|nr:hypothetical protein [Pseudomonas rhodesiae]OXS21907.1 hypothetical protein CGU36_10890 [Pseudomonas fluorescens]OZO48871.1 hypothetical protein CGU37_09935 [Pseudomonas fluorescens]QVN02403.1 hypothetical protein JYG38_02775 [Pseudomonas rhodesiae]TGY19218.1 hypothetical protein E5845_09980 [Pseudomonas fluorescens]WLG40254.1 hypothetical protein PSH93_03620 [Pseudomonas rhodesiae]
MRTFSDLSLQLARNSTTANQNVARAGEDPATSEDIEGFYELIIRQDFANFAYFEQGRVTHEMIKTTIESFQ